MGFMAGDLPEEDGAKQTERAKNILHCDHGGRRVDSTFSHHMWGIGMALKNTGVVQSQTAIYVMF